MASVSMTRSLMLDRCEAAVREGIRVLNEEWLVGGITPTESEEANERDLEIDFSTDEPLSPGRINQEGPSEN